MAIASSLFFIVDLEEEGVLILPIPIPNHCAVAADNIKVTAYEGLGHSDALWDGAYSEPEMHSFMLDIRRSYWINSSYVF